MTYTFFHSGKFHKKGNYSEKIFAFRLSFQTLSFIADDDKLNFSNDDISRFFILLLAFK